MSTLVMSAHNAIKALKESGLNETQAEKNC